MFELLHLILFLKSTSNSKYFNCPRGAIKESVHSITSQMICKETVAVKSANLPLTCVTETAVMICNQGYFFILSIIWRL